MAVNYDRPVQIAEGVYWVGFRDEKSNLTCNPYLIVEGSEAVLIDGGSRTDFASVMMKILQVGIDPQQVSALVYQHYDPDLCGSMANFIDMCDNPRLKIISEQGNNVFISFYIPRSKVDLLETIDGHGFNYTFNQRTLQFVQTPYSHSPGSFVTYDVKTKTLFSSDLFGSFATRWALSLDLQDDCFACPDHHHCPNGRKVCPVEDILAFHRQIMPCNKALRVAVSRLRDLDIQLIAPQHGSLIQDQTTIQFIMDELSALEDVGIDGIA